MSVKAGRMDYAGQASLNMFYDELNSMKTNIRLHAAFEENFIHPLLSTRVSGGAEKLEKVHHSIHHMHNGLVSHFDGIRSKSNKSMKYQELGLEFYLAFNRFIAFLLGHIDDEVSAVNLKGIALRTLPVSEWELILWTSSADSSVLANAMDYANECIRPKEVAS